MLTSAAAVDLDRIHTIDVLRTQRNSSDNKSRWRSKTLLLFPEEHATYPKNVLRKNPWPCDTVVKFHLATIGIRSVISVSKRMTVRNNSWLALLTVVYNQEALPDWYGLLRSEFVNALHLPTEAEILAAHTSRPA